MIGRRPVALALALLAAPGASLVALQNAAADGSAMKEIEAWRAKHEEDYTREYVPLAGLFYLKSGVNTAGSAPANDIVLPARVPPSIGRFVLEGQRVRFEPAPGGKILFAGKPVASAVEMRPDAPADRLAIGDIELWVHTSGDKPAIRMRDPQSDIAKSFAGYQWFPIDLQYRVVGRFVRDPAPRQLKIPTLVGGFDMYTTEGVVEFSLTGRQLRLRPMTTRPERLFFILRDTTSGKETYEAARFLYADLRPDGTTILDFNQLYNPPCAFNPYTTCPLPLPENRLPIPLLVGEKAYRKK
jgi:uncharacterized protein (DUF1684 family)